MTGAARRRDRTLILTIFLEFPIRAGLWKPRNGEQEEVWFVSWCLLQLTSYVEIVNL